MITTPQVGLAREMTKACALRHVRLSAVAAFMCSSMLIILSGTALAREQAPTFGERLAEAASAQRWVPVIYNPAYVKLDYPGGDVPWYTGVCTDVIVRAYRKLGIDLQVEVYKSRVGSGDRNIDHRRVPVLRKFFRKRGISIPVTRDPSKYRPGDIVTYYMPDGRYSKTHIAIVAKERTKEGRPYVVHNRGLGVQIEDWLFQAKITGHYRFQKEK
ncbi:MAG: DUF1287 domain-containing protein [Pseudomonadota bacterium]